MFCENCGNEITNGENVCPVCGVKNNFYEDNNPNQDYSDDMNQNAQPYNYNDYNAVDEDEAYRTQAKKQWYCFLFPILFFIPMLKDKKDIPGNKEVANAALIVFLVNLIVVIINKVINNITDGSVITSLLSFANFVFELTMLISALCNKAIKLPIKIIK